MWAEINGTKLFFDTIGTQYVPDGRIMKERPVLFLLHGGPGADHTDFFPEHEQLQDCVYQIMVDHRNCGLSEKGDVLTSSLEQNADDIDALRRYLGLDKIFVLGISYGGMVAQQYAIKYQEHLYGLILESTAPSHRYNDELSAQMDKMASPEQKEFLQYYRTIKKEDLTPEKSAQLTYDYWRILGSLYVSRCAPEVYAEICSRGTINQAVHTAQRKELEHFDFREDLRSVHCPTLILCGENDFITPPSHSVEISESIENSELIILENCSHEITHDWPERVFAEIRKFVNENHH